MTAAHVPSGSFHFNDLSVWPPQMAVHMAGDTPPVVLDLVRNRTPLFRHYGVPAGMFDVMAVDVPEANWPQVIYTLDASAQMKQGDKITTFGFPSYPAIWPGGILDGSYHSQSGLLTLADIPVIPGYSGGPIVRKKKLVGMLTGGQGDLATIIPISVLRKLFE